MGQRWSDAAATDVRGALHFHDAVAGFIAMWSSAAVSTSSNPTSTGQVGYPSRAERTVRYRRKQTSPNVEGWYTQGSHVELPWAQFWILAGRLTSLHNGESRSRIVAALR